MRDALIDHIYQASHDDAALTSLADKLIDRFDLTSMLMGWLGHDGEFRMVISANYFGESDLGDYFLHYSEKDPWMAASMSVLESGRALRMSDHVPTEAFVASDLYRKFLLPRGYDICYALSLPAVSPLGMGAMALHKGPDKGDFTDEDVAELARLGHALETLQKSRARLRTSEVAEQGFAMVADRLQAAAIVLGEKGHFVEANKAGLRFLKEGDLLLESGGKVAGFNGSGKWFERAIEAATSKSGAQATSGRFVRPDGSAVVLSMMPFGTEGFGRRAVLIVNFPQTLGEAHESAIAQAFHLTSSEAAVVRHLANGKTAEAIAKLRGTSLQTVRVQLRNAMMKTHCTRQAELVDLVRQFVSVADIDHNQFVV
ncbi:helix-turn-helix transcriptional regulator [Sphingomicrobium nitratireducens]|uniref:helix-turn-helix transcriptional regulator n=1 Tax=Sphingomicrobium nitratireducens TaxID=2964666 RepID=UPI00223EED17|nr:helix-turn-helix domain-containing protein [Sphingomicrobium nitratireducens]